MLSKEWFSASEIAAESLPGVPSTESGVLRVAKGLFWASQEGKGTSWRKRSGRGGGIEFHYSLLPERARREIVIRFGTRPEKPKAEVIAATSIVAISAYTQASEKKKVKAELRLQVLREIELEQRIVGRTKAIKSAANAHGIVAQTIYNWIGRTGGVERQNAVAALVSQERGRTVRAPCSDGAWQFLLSLYLRLNQPPFSACWKEVKHKADKEGWVLPSKSTLERRVQSDVPVPVRVLYREGEDAVKRLYPYQERDRSMFHALEAVNADGHIWDMKVQWPDGEIGRPMMVAFQDLYSNLILSWRVDKSENKEMVRLAFADLVQTYGIPKHCWLDNGRAFASKWLTGGIKNRFRFTVREEEPHGILPLLGTEVHWTLPYSGQSKPIERAFGEFASNYAKHPKFAGAGTGNSPMRKPENYGETVIPLADFLAVAAEQIAEHNAREGRKTKVCQGKLSFQQAFNASYANSVIAKATPDHLQLLLLAAEGIQASSRDGSFKLQDNRYWSEDLLRYRGQPIVVRFDPQALTEEVRAYAMDGTFICAAALQGAAKFNDAEAARAHAQARNAWKKAQKDAAKALVRMSVTEAAALTRSIEPAPTPETKVVRPFFGGSSAALALKSEIEADEEQSESEAMFVRAMRLQRAQRGEHLTLLPAVEDDD